MRRRYVLAAAAVVLGCAAPPAAAQAPVPDAGSSARGLVDVASPATPASAPLPATGVTPAGPPGEAQAPREDVGLASDAELLVRASLHGLSAPLRWGGREWALAGASVGAVALVSTIDGAGRDFMADARSDRNDDMELLVEPFGAEGSLYMLGGMLAAGLVLDDAKLRGTAVEALAAGAVAAGIITPQLQLIIGRAKPRDDLPPYTFDPFGGDRSLPSGHTTQAFAVASVIATEYDHPLVQVAAYGMATAVGVSRMYRRSHFASDVVGAAIIGTAVGTTVARYGIARRGAVTVTPMVDDGAAGLVVGLPIGRGFH